MIDPDTKEGLLEATRRFWSMHVRTDEFQNLAYGKEVGHRIADYVEEHTVRLIDAEFAAGHQLGTDGQRLVRGIGDVWIKSNDIFNPVNIKSGELRKKGQPNMVALKRLLRGILNRHFDSYYLLIVKFDPKVARADVNLVDLLDYLDYTHFDSGPGQIMLREADFYVALDSGYTPPRLTIVEKVHILLTKLREGDERLLKNREREQRDLTAKAEQFDIELPLDQRSLNIR